MAGAQFQQSFHLVIMTQLMVTIYFVSVTNGFLPTSGDKIRSHPSVRKNFCLRRHDCRILDFQPKERRRRIISLYGNAFEEDDDDDDDYIDTDSLGDWRNFRRSLSMGDNDDGSAATAMASAEREITENEKVLEKQNKKLAEEYASDIWAHQTPTVSPMQLHHY